MPIKLQGPPAAGHNAGDAAGRAAPAPGVSVSIDADIVVHSCGYVHQGGPSSPAPSDGQAGGCPKPSSACARPIRARGASSGAHGAGDQRMRGIKRSDRARSGCVACRQRASPAGAAPARSHGGRRPQQRWRRRRARTLHLRCERPAELERVEHIDRRRTRPPGARDGGARLQGAALERQPVRPDRRPCARRSDDNHSLDTGQAAPSQTTSARRLHGRPTRTRAGHLDRQGHTAKQRQSPTRAGTAGRATSSTTARATGAAGRLGRLDR